MSEHDKSNGGAGPEVFAEPKKPAGRTWITWVAVFGGIILLMLFRDRWENQGGWISQYRFEELLDAGQIAQGTINYDPQNQALNEITGKYWTNQNDPKIEVSFRSKVRLTGRLEDRLLRLPNFEVRQPNTMLLSVVWSLLPILVIAVFIWFFFIRQIRRVTKNSPSTADLSARSLEQQDRFDKILDRWERQADRMDAILDRGERAGDERK